jgi:hypothetical protein
MDLPAQARSKIKVKVERNHGRIYWSEDATNVGQQEGIPYQQRGRRDGQIDPLKIRITHRTQNELNLETIW